MISTSAIALSGMSAAQGGLQVAAHNIANQGTPGFRRQQAVLSADAAGGVQASLATAKESGASLESDVVGLLQAKHAFLANLVVFRASDRMTGALLDIRA
jgi:flagellar basal-body rod protein FlgC